MAQMQKKVTMAELIRYTAIAWSSGYSEKDITNSLKIDYKLNDEDIDTVLKGCNLLQIEMIKNLESISHKPVSLSN